VATLNSAGSESKQRTDIGYMIGRSAKRSHGYLEGTSLRSPATEHALAPTIPSFRSRRGVASVREGTGCV